MHRSYCGLSVPTSLVGSRNTKLVNTPIAYVIPVAVWLALVPMLFNFNHIHLSANKLACSDRSNPNSYTLAGNACCKVQPLEPNVSLAHTIASYAREVGTRTLFMYVLQHKKSFVSINIQKDRYVAAVDCCFKCRNTPKTQGFRSKFLRFRI